MIYPKWYELDWTRMGSKLGLVNCREVAPNLFVGAANSVGHPPAGMKWAGVVALCNVDPSIRGIYPANSLFLPFEDGDSIPGHTLNQALALYDSLPDQPVLIHCAMGLSRSASVAYAILRLRHGLEENEALARVRLENDTSYPMPRTLASAEGYARRIKRHGRTLPDND